MRAISSYNSNSPDLGQGGKTSGSRKTSACCCGASVVIKGIVAIEALRPHHHAAPAMTMFRTFWVLTGSAPSQRDLDYKALVETALAKLCSRDIGLGEEGADLHAGRETPGNVYGNALVAREILPGMKAKNVTVPGDS